jgi:hypothetical protein
MICIYSLAFNLFVRRAIGASLLAKMITARMIIRAPTIRNRVRVFPRISAAGMTVTMGSIVGSVAAFIGPARS